ncbi:MAG: Rpn family recombination-promoting nuclease/putative transposase [Clostridia bacterium]|nr:Rpn family recombination-promoting nuclease/putative transposase [Clostridia bacterium]
MGVMDTEGKQYLSNPVFFADAFNYLLYDGEQVIKPDELQELDTTELTVPYGNNARVPVQKYRDLLKMWNAMMDENAIYVILGAELQDKVHYGMPVKDGLYDMLGYSKQIAEIKRSYKQEDATEEGEITVDNGVLKIKLTSEEFLSGLRKDDKLIPIITAVVYFGDEPWDGPKSLFEMLDVRDERLYRFLSDYKLNLISPVDMDEDEFEKFHTELGYAMRLLKHQSEDADEIIVREGHRKVSSETAYFLNAAMKLNLEFEVEPGGVDMCKSMERRDQKNEVTGVIKGMKLMGASDNDIIGKIVETYHVTREYVLALLAPKQA